MSTGLDQLAIHISADSESIYKITSVSNKIWLAHFNQCEDCKEAPYTCYEIDEVVPVMRALLPGSDEYKTSGVES